MFTENRGSVETRFTSLIPDSVLFRLGTSMHFPNTPGRAETRVPRSLLVLYTGEGRERDTLETSHRQLRLFRRSTDTRVALSPRPSAFASSLANSAMESPFCQGFPCLVIPRGVLRTCTYGLDSLPPATNTKIAIGPGQSRRPVASHAAPTLSRSD